MFRRVDATAPEPLRISLDGEMLEVPAGISVAAALLYAGQLPTRYSAISASPRAPFCMMGVCFECVAEIDGVRGLRACQVEVRAGMCIRRQEGFDAGSGEVA